MATVPETARAGEATSAGMGWRAGNVHVEESRTVPQLFLRRCESFSDRIAYGQEENGEWKTYTFAEYRDQVAKAALGLARLGAGAGGHVAIWGETMAEWTILDLAVMANRAASVGIFQTSTPDQGAYIINDCSASIVCVDTPERLQTVLSIREKTPSVQHYVIWNGEPAGDARVLSYSDMVAMGGEELEARPNAFDELVAAVEPDDSATLIYTSGTTGPPKGAKHTHHTALNAAYSMFNVIGIGPDDTMTSFLSMSHVAEHFVSFFVRLYAGCSTYFIPDIKRVAELLPEIQPTLLGGVPRLFEKVHTRVMSTVEQSSAVKQALFRWALGVGLEVHNRGGQHLPPWLAMQHRMADRLVLSKIRERMGGRVRFIVCGAAPIEVDVINFFNAIGVPFFEVYGMTECGGVSHGNRPGHCKPGTVGKVLPGFECKLAEDGEILVRGEGVFAGYYNMPDKTAETIDEEKWLHTGDIGEVDNEGYLRITDRKKNLIVTANGKNVAPSNIELLLTRDPLIGQAVVIGDKRSYLVALLTLSEEELAARAEADGTTVEALRESDAVKERVEKAVAQANTEVARYEQIKKYKLLPREFSIEEDEMTPTLKLKRKPIMEHFAQDIEAMYEGS